MDSFERFSEKKLPDKTCFYRPLEDRTTDDNGNNLDGYIIDEEYLTCIKIWNEFNMKNIGDYHDHYLKKDLLLLADVFGNFIDTYFKFCKLDPCHYFSSPGLSWNVMLKMNRIKLEQISDNNKIDNDNKDLKNSDSTKLLKYITYLDENNLYSMRMSQYLPYGEF